MSRTVHKQFPQVPLTVSTDQIIGQIDLTSCNGVSVQINCPALAGGSMKLQRSNDNKTWEDIPSATATLAPSTAKVINVADFYAAHIQILVTLSAGPGNYDFFCLGKER